MPSLNDLKRAYYLRMLGLSSSSILSEADLQARLYAANAGIASNRKFVANRFYRHSGMTNTASTNLMTTGTIYFVPFIVGSTQRFDRLSIDVTAAGIGGSTISVGLYDSLNGMPNARLAQVTGLNSDVIAFLDNAIDVTLSPGLYFPCVLSLGGSTAPTIRTYGAHMNDNISSLGNPAGANNNHYLNVGQASLPAVADVITVGAGAAAPMMVMRAA